MEMKWYTIYTKPRCEKKVADALARKKMEVFCPLNKVVRQWNDRKKVLTEPLFTSYLFVRVPESRLAEVKRMDGVINFAYWLGKPAAVKEEEIEIIKDFLSEHKYVQLERTSVSMNDAVKVVKGPLMHQEGNVLTIKNNTVKVILPSLGFIMVAEVKQEAVEKIILKEQVA
jgi:transcription antitermination factor NusG